MKKQWSAIGVAALTLLLAVSVGCPAESKQKASSSEWTSTFDVAKENLASVGQNPFFILEPGYSLHYKGGKETLRITVLPETKVVDGVETRVVEEREEKNGQLVEISRNYFAIDKTTNDVYYFGEHVDIYKNGKVVAHEGAWLSGVDGAKFGMMMPGKPTIGNRFYQEHAPGKAMDRCEIVALEGELKTPAGTFKNCLRAKETSALERGASYKVYAPGVGLIKDEECLLVKVVKADATKKTVEKSELGVRTAPPNCPACAMGLTAEFVFNRLDDNGDKIVTVQEFMKSPGIQDESAARDAVGRIDQDTDGSLSWEEFAAAYKARHANGKPSRAVDGSRPDGRGDDNRFAQVFMLRNDQNGDGKVDRSEFRGAETGFNRLDQNKNGFIEIISKLDDGKQIFYRNINDQLLAAEGAIRDRVGHVTEKGYEVWADAIRPTLGKLMQ